MILECKVCKKRWSPNALEEEWKCDCGSDLFDLYLTEEEEEGKG